MANRQLEISCLMVVSSSDEEAFLDQALTSISGSQSLSANEYVLVLNGPLAGGVVRLLSQFRERMGGKVKFVNRDTMGTLSDALNQGLKSCSCELVARMDPDDIALPLRFERQLAAFQDNQALDICGSYISEFDYDPSIAKLRKLPESHRSILAFAKWRNPLAHPSVMFRKQAILDIGGYPAIGKAQDYLLWVTAIVSGYELANLSEPLLLFRSGKTHMERRNWSYFTCEVDVFWRMRKMGFLTTWQFIANLLLRSVVRSQPTFLKTLIYKLRR